MRIISSMASIRRQDGSRAMATINNNPNSTITSMPVVTSITSSSRSITITITIIATKAANTILTTISNKRTTTWR